MSIEKAHEAGIAWADREAEMLRDQGQPLPATWQGTTSDALACVDTHERDDIGDLVERDEDERREEAESVNAAAMSRWAEIVADA